MQGLNFLPWRAQYQQRRRHRFFVMLLMTALFCVLAAFWQGFALSTNTLSNDQRRLLAQQALLDVSDLTLTLTQRLEHGHALHEQRAEFRDWLIATGFLASVLSCLSECHTDGIDLLQITYSDQTLQLEGWTETGVALDELGNRLAFAAGSAKIRVLTMQWHQRDARYQFALGVLSNEDGNVFLTTDRSDGF